MMVMYVPGWRMHGWGVYIQMKQFHKEGLGDICKGDVVFRSGLEDGEWRLENLQIYTIFTPSWPDIVQRF